MLKFTLIAAAVALVSTLAQAELIGKDGCPRSASCHKPPYKPLQRDCQDLGPCQCPPGYALIGSYDSDLFTQQWECKKFIKNCEIDCLDSNIGFLGFCESDTVIEKPYCEVPPCFFTDQRIYARLGLYLNKDKDGWYVIEIEDPSAIGNAGSCNLCKCGTPQCLKRIPYFDYTSRLF